MSYNIIRNLTDSLVIYNSNQAQTEVIYSDLMLLYEHCLRGGCLQFLRQILMPSTENYN